MKQEKSAKIGEYFAELPDPRSEMNREHKLLDIVVMTICAVICGAENWVTVQLFAEAKAAWFGQFLALPGGIPSHDTFWRVFRQLDSERFQACFLRWVQAVSELQVGEVIAIDGKQVRRSQDRAGGKAAIHLISAWASENGLVLGQRRVDEKSNEITAIPELLAVLELSGCLVTMDAMGTQTEIAEKILAQEADYLLALKGNHPLLLEDVTLLFDHLPEVGFVTTPQSYARQVEKDHGRREVRQAWVVTEPELIHNLRTSEVWPHLQALVKIESDRYLEVEQKQEHFVRYFIASFPITAARAIEATRAHWHIENSLHWVLDVAFREDECRVRKDHGAHNFAILRHIALNLLKQDTTTKAGIKARRLKAGWDHAYLLHLLSPLMT